MNAEFDDDVIYYKTVPNSDEFDDVTVFSSRFTFKKMKKQYFEKETCKGEEFGDN